MNNREGMICMLIAMVSMKNPAPNNTNRLERNLQSSHIVKTKGMEEA
jgi:hypothetical protein